MENRHIGREMRKNVQKYGSRVAMRYKEDGGWHDISWSEFGEMSNAVAKALIESDLMSWIRLVSLPITDQSGQLPMLELLMRGLPLLQFTRPVQLNRHSM
jgi:hypothetical protein